MIENNLYLQFLFPCISCKIDLLFLLLLLLSVPELQRPSKKYKTNNVRRYIVRSMP